MSSHVVPHSDLLVFIEQSPAAMALFDSEMRYLAYSSRWVRDYSLEVKGDLRGRSHYDVFPEIPEVWRDLHQKVLGGEIVQTDLDTFAREDGTTQYLRYEVRPWYSGEDIGGLVMLTEDLTAQVKATEGEKEARRSSEGVQAAQAALYSAARDVEATMWAFDKDLTMTVHVGAPLEALGVGQGWNVGNNMAEVYGDLPGFVEVLHRVLEGKREQIDVKVEDRMFDTVVSPVQGPNGEVLGGVGISIDVTDRNLRAKEAAEHAQRLRVLADMFAHDEASEIQQISRALDTMRSLLGLEMGILSRIASGDERYEVLACSVPEESTLAPGDVFPLGETYCSLTLDQKDVIAIDEMAVSDHRRHPCYQAFGLESYIGAAVLVDGETFGTLNFSSSSPRGVPFGDTDRDLVRLVARWAGGLLERESREQRLRQSEQRFRGIFNSQFQFQGLLLPDGTLLEVNDTAVAFAGLAREELVGKKFWNCHWWQVGEATQNQLREAVETAAHGEFVRYTVEVQGVEGNRVPIDFSIKPLRDEDTGEVVMLIPEGRVIAEIIETQQRLEKTVQALAAARDEAEAANRAKSNFLAAMSHEIRTPMNAVVGYSDLLMTTSLDETQQEYIATIQRAGDRLLRLIDDVLDFSKVEANRLDLEIVAFEVEPLVVSVLEQFAPRAAETGVELAYVPPVSTSIPTLLGDEKRIHQVLSNLVSNAVKFTHDGTVELTVRTSPSNEERAVELEIEVRDTGIGIGPDRLEDIFRPFVQADSSMTRQYGGTGLGLAIARQFVHRMGGTLSVESAEGRGSAFRVRLPLRLADASVRRVVPTASGSLLGKRALVVDDQPESLALTVAHTERWGLIVESTADPEEALAWIDEGRTYDLAVLDMEMPSMDGIMLAKAIRERDAALPLAVLSSRTELGDAADSVDAIAVKPVAPDALNALLHKAIRRAANTKPLTPIIRFHEAPPRLAVPEAAPSTTRLRILVAEDEPDNQKLTLQMLRLLGYEAHLVASGAEALEQLHATPYDVVLMDVMMPGMDGLEATRRLRSELPPARQPRVVALTARALRSDREACLAAGMDDYLSKPVRIGDLARALSAVGV